MAVYNLDSVVVSVRKGIAPFDALVEGFANITIDGVLANTIDESGLPDEDKLYCSVVWDSPNSHGQGSDGGDDVSGGALINTASLGRVYPWPNVSNITFRFAQGNPENNGVILATKTFQITVLGSKPTFVTERDALHRQVLMNVQIDPMSTLQIPHNMGAKPTVIAVAAPSLVGIGEVTDTYFVAENKSLKVETVSFLVSRGHAAGDDPADFYRPNAIIDLEQKRRNYVIDGLRLSEGLVAPVQESGAVPYSASVVLNHGHHVIANKLAVVHAQELDLTVDTLEIGQRYTFMVWTQLGRTLADLATAPFGLDGGTIAWGRGNAWYGLLSDAKEHGPTEASIRNANSVTAPEYTDYVEIGLAVVTRTEDTVVTVDIIDLLPTSAPKTVPVIPVMTIVGYPDGAPSIDCRLTDVYGVIINTIQGQTILIEGMSENPTPLFVGFGYGYQTVVPCGTGYLLTMPRSAHGEGPGSGTFAVNYALNGTSDPVMLRATGPTGLSFFLLVPPAAA